MSAADARPSLSQQVQAVELAYLNNKGGVDVLRALVNSRKRSPEELRLAELGLPPLRQAWLTMKFIEANADKIRELTSPTKSGTRDDADETGPTDPY